MVSCVVIILTLRYWIPHFLDEVIETQKTSLDCLERQSWGQRPGNETELLTGASEVSMSENVCYLP